MNLRTRNEPPQSRARGSGAAVASSQRLVLPTGGPLPPTYPLVQHGAPAHVCTPGRGKGLGSSGKGSWLKTESLEEQVLLASPLEGE